MAALYAGHVHESGRTTDERPAGKDELGNGLPAAFRQSARSIGEPFAAIECGAHQGMSLEPLEFIERRQIRILIIEMDHEADRNQVGVIVIEKGAAAGALIQRPTECVLNQARAVFFGRDLPELLEADAEFLRLAAFVQAEALHQNLAE